MKYVAGYAVDENPVLVGDVNQAYQAAALDAQSTSLVSTSGRNSATQADRKLPQWVVNDRKVGVQAQWTAEGNNQVWMSNLEDGCICAGPQMVRLFSRGCG